MFEAPATYTVYLKGFESIGSQSGLSLTNAFRRVVSLSHRSFAFNTEDGKLVLRLARDGDTDVLRSDSSIEPTARRELMLMAVDGRLSGFAAVEDCDFIELRQAAAKARHAA